MNNISYFKPALSIIAMLIMTVSTPSIGQRTSVMYLSGKDKDQTKQWDFQIDNGMNSGSWTKIAVPSNWETQGFGVYKYGREDRSKEPVSNETAIYRHQFEVPAEWKGRVIHIVFEGVMTDTRVEINGKSAGPVHQGGFYEFTYDITGLLNYGKNNALQVTVKNWSENESVNQAEREADFWIFGGIYRPVYLTAKPRQHIERLAIDARARGEFKVDVFLKNNKNLIRAEARVYNRDGQRIGDPIYKSIAKGQSKLTMASFFTTAMPWSPEFPNLYTVEVTIFDKKSIAHSVTKRFGFRTVELREGEGFYVNGKKIMFKGVNRHSFWPESGRCLSKEISIMDVTLMKAMNMNAVRMSHYPPDKHFLDVCDSLGLFVLDELTGWQDAYDTQVGEKLVRELVIRDLNHPCVVAWDNGNEGGNNFDLVDDYHLYDPQKRPVIHPWDIFNGMDTNHYKDFDCCPGMLFHGREVFFPTEFLHGIYDGGHGAGLEDYWNLMRSNPLSAGGFLWVLGDEGLVRVDQDGRIDTHGSNAPDGILGPFREKEGSFYAIKEIWSPVVVNRTQIGNNFDGILEIENRYHYTNLNQCVMEWELVDYPGPDDPETVSQIARQKKVKLPDVQPGGSAAVQLDLPRDYQQYDGLNIRFIDPYGQELYTYSWPLRSASGINGKILKKDIRQSVEVQDRVEELEVRAGNVSFTFDKKTGSLDQVSNGGKAISFGGGPILASGDAIFTGLEHQRSEGGYLVRLNYDGDVKKAQFTISEDGLLTLDYEYLPKKGAYDFLGINFNYPEEKTTAVKWLGRGPYRVWKNRMKGQAFGVWEKAYNNTVTGESGWIYPEFKGYHADLYWVKIENDEHPFTIYCDSPGMFFRLFTPENPEGAYNENTDGVFPDGDLSFLHAISPIGTKFKRADQLGPQGQKNIVQYHGKHQSYDCRLIFDFR